MSVIIFIIIIVAIIFINNKYKKNNGMINNIVKVNAKEQENKTDIKDEVIVEQEYLKSENEIIENIIKKELKENKYDGKDIKEVEKKRLKIIIIFSILNLIFVLLIFFHLPIYVYLLELINILAFAFFMNKYNTIKYIKKEIKSRPDEEIANIISCILASGTVKKSKKIIISVILNCVAIIIPMIIFINPITFYEKGEDGYYLRFYAAGLTNATSVTIPETYKGEKVVGLRGDVFSNMYFLKNVDLPNSIEVIRGKAFKNDILLSEVNLPDNLTYLGGSSFSGCTSLKSITIPEGVTIINGNTFEDCKSLTEIKLHDNITEIHGETFKNCSSLITIELPNKITEIRGNTFEGCTSLETISIPEGVIRIGGHAFYECSSLKKVDIPSTITEIGSSAFRQCTSLENIKIPSKAMVDSKAFKESPTKITKY